MARFICLGYLFICVSINLVAAIRVKDMIYTSFEGVSACFRRHNGTHQFGCTSSRSGSIGVIHLVEGEADVRWLEQNATAGPYAIVLPFSMFTRQYLFRLRNTKNINGILLIKNSSEPYPDSYSPEDTCPNRYSGYKNCTDTSPWNPKGSSLLLEDWPFPMFYIENETKIEEVKSCFFKHNAHDLESQRKRPLCALEMKSFMYAAVDSKTCIRRNDFKLLIDPILYCDPLGDRNIHWPLTPLNKDKNSIILVTARLDASSLFDRISPGAENVVTGIVTLLATAYHLNNIFKNATLIYNTNVIFSLFNGEAFDYIGSSRLIYDLKEGNFHALGGVKLKFDDIKSVIEFGQLSNEKLYLHSNNAQNNTLMENLGKELNAEVLKDSVPPASIQSFLKENPNLPAVVISNHGIEFKNRYYNGILDDAHNLHFNINDTSNALTASLANIAIQVAEVLYANITGKPALPVNATTQRDIENHISDMLFCYLKSAKCKLFMAASPPGTKISNQVLSLYVGVHKVANIATTLTGQLLAFLTRQEVNLNETACYDKHLIWMAGYNCTGICINTTVNYSIAMSPAFIIDGYNMNLATYSTWTESVWETLSVRMFLKSSEATQNLTMILGSVVAGMSFIIVYYIESRSEVIFNTRKSDSESDTSE